MRKKYLSALLFGALLFASAGTFTSCKDYDDDISNLQEQINTVVADLNDLKALVGDGGVSSVTFDEATGVLTVVDAAGTKTYTIKTPAAEVGEVKVVIDDERNLVVNDEVIGKVGDVVTVNAEGYLCVNGVATEIKAGKYAILENESDNTYTITLPDANGNMQTITLLKSVASNITITPVANTTDFGAYGNVEYSIFTEINPEESTADRFQANNGIAWGVASSDVDWKGPKGAVKAGQLLIGQQNTLSVNVYPQNTELDKQALALVDINGNEAPVTIVPTPSDNGDGTTGSRATALGGKWDLNITMGNTITANNIGTAFAKVTGETPDGNYDVWSNKTYALRVNGNILTDYVFVIDTDDKACEMALDDELAKNNGIIKVDGRELTQGTTFNVELGSHELTFEQASVYDYMFEIVAADENNAEAWGIKLENNVLTAENTATAAGKTIHLNVKLLGVNGEQFDFEYKTINDPIAIKFGSSTTEVITLPASTYKVDPAEYANSLGKGTAMWLDLGELFSGLTANEAISVKKGETTLRTTDETFAFLRQTIVANQDSENDDIVFYKADKSTEVDFDDANDNIKDIKWAKVVYNTVGYNDALWNPKATLGEHILTMTLKDENKNEIRKANIPVNVTVPTFFELFTKSAAWTDNTALAVVDDKGLVDLKQLYNDKTKVQNALFDNASTFIVNNEVAGTVPTSGENVLDLNTKAVKSNKLQDLASELVYEIVPGCDAFTVTSGDFTMDVVTRLDAAKFIYYVDGKETEIVVRPESKNTVKAITGTGSKRAGLSLYKAGVDHIFMDKTEVNKLTLDGVTGVNPANLSVKFDDKAGDLANAYFDEKGNLIVEGLAKGNYTTVLTITYKKASVVDGTEVHETFEIPLNVQGVE